MCILIKETRCLCVYRHTYRHSLVQQILKVFIQNILCLGVQYLLSYTSQTIFDTCLHLLHILQQSIIWHSILLFPRLNVKNKQMLNVHFIFGFDFCQNKIFLFLQNILKEYPCTSTNNKKLNIFKIKTFLKFL